MNWEIQAGIPLPPPSRSPGPVSNLTSEERRQLALETARRWRRRNSAKLSAKTARWAKANPGRWNAYNNARRAAKLRRTPAWADLNAIKAIYADAAARGLTVDHIIPLRGKLVSGLHVPENLQAMSRADNSRKLNHFEVA